MGKEFPLQQPDRVLLCLVRKGVMGAWGSEWALEGLSHQQLEIGNLREVLTAYVDLGSLLERMIKPCDRLK